MTARRGGFDERCDEDTKVLIAYVEGVAVTLEQTFKVVENQEQRPLREQLSQVVGQHLRLEPAEEELLQRHHAQRFKVTMKLEHDCFGRECAARTIKCVDTLKTRPQAFADM